VRPGPRVQEQVAGLLGARPVSWTSRDEGGYSGGGRWTVELDDGRRAFVKHHGSRVLHVEHLVYAGCSAGFLPGLLGYAELSGDPEEPGAPSGGGPEDDASSAVLAIEDLSHARWGTPLEEPDLRALAEALDELATVSPPEGLLVATRDAGQGRLPTYAEGLVRNGLVDEEWVTRHLPTVHEAASAVDPRGDGLVHPDLFVQNWCRTPRGAVLVDWAWSFVGDPMFTRAWAEAGVRAAGGPAGIVLPPGQPGWAALVAVLFVGEVAGTPDEPLSRLQESERREAHAALRWACEELDLPAPITRPDFLPAGPWRP
jgi:hypothetical protein